MKSPRSIMLATFFLLPASQAHAITGAICISAKLNGSLKMRATGVCKSKEIQLGSFDGTTLQFSGINVQVVSGSGTTSGPVNGKGNLIVGYNETTFGQTRTGSHNLVVGDEHEYTSYGGLVAGENNFITGPFASVTGGAHNRASESVASVSGGEGNTASGSGASVSGGGANTASGFVASVSGGESLVQPADNGWAAGSKDPANVVVGDFESP
jgi:hypothetical protein